MPIDIQMGSVFDNDFMEGEVRLKGIEIFRKVSKGSTFIIRADDESVNKEQGERLFDTLEMAFGWENQVLGEKAKKKFWKKGEIILTLRDKMAGLMQNNFEIKKKYALGKSKETVAAAIFHEILEMWRDDEMGLTGEGAPLMAEYLFCGDDRSFFKELCDDHGKSSDSHQRGWDLVLVEMGIEIGNPQDLYEKMQNWKKSLTSENKISIVKDRLLEWRQPK